MSSSKKTSKRLFPYIQVIDFETFSKVDIKTAGAYRYAQDESTMPLCLCYIESTDPSDEPYIWLPGDSYPFEKGHKMAAHNAEFEYYIWKFVMTRKYGWPEPPPLDMWIDTAAVCRYRGYPGKLEFAAQALRLKYQKDMEGHRIMLKLSRPRRPSASNPDTRWTPETKPDDFEKLYDYCADDVLTEREIFRTLGELPPVEQRVWEHNVTLNLRGVPCDPYLAERIIEMKDLHLEKVNARLTAITRGEITKATQTARITEYLGFPSLDRDFLEHKADAYIRTPRQREIVDLRLSASRTSTAKYEALLASLAEDGRMHGLLMYHAAQQTARYGGALIQPHNLPRPKMKINEIMSAVDMIHSDLPIDEVYDLFLDNFGSDLMKVFSDLIRSALWAEEEHEFAVCDFSNVEARILAWEADEEVLLKDFRAGRDPYLGMASRVYKRKITKDDSFERGVGKAGILGCGFGMQGPKFHATCHSWGIPIELELAQKVVNMYRERHKKVVGLWYSLNEIVLNVVDSCTMAESGKCLWRMVNLPVPTLECVLPSGKSMYYPEPEIRQVPAPWNHDKIIDQLYYKTWDIRMQRWIRVPTYGAKLVENITQANARELLVDALMRMEKSKLPVLLHIHDEVLSHVRNGKKALSIMQNIMSNPPAWAKDIPLAAEGYVHERFRKG